MLFAKLVAAAPVLSPAAALVYRRSCVAGTYQCSNPTNGTATVQVCSAGFWVLSAICSDGWDCVGNAAGGCTCQK